MASASTQSKKVLVQLSRSISNADGLQRANLRGLGLRKLNQVVELDDTPAIRGMIRKIAHLVVVNPA